MVTFFDTFPSASGLESICDKKWIFSTYKMYFYDRLAQMFRYDNLPESIPSEMLDLYLLSGGWAFFTNVEGKPYVFQGGLGGEYDAYYRPTICTVSNPALNISKEYIINEDGILIRNDKFRVGLDFMITRYAALMAENIITMKTADIILRCIALISAPDDSTKASAEEYLKHLANGELEVIAENQFFDGIRLQSPPSNNGSYLTQFIELHQYYKGSFYNEIGLNANFNMKREAIGKGEASLSEDSLLPLCDSMLECRQEDLNKVNEMFGYDIKVSFNSAWEQNKLESIYELREMKNDSNQDKVDDSSQLEGGEEIENDSGAGERNSDVGFENSEVDERTSNVGDGQENSGDEEETEITSEENNSVKSDEFSASNESTEENNSSDGITEVQVNVEVKIEGGDDINNEEFNEERKE